MQESGTYYAKFRDGEGVVQEVPTGCRTRDAALSQLKRLTDRAEKVKAKILTPAEDRMIDHQAVPLSEHLEEFRKHLKNKGVTARRITETLRRLNLIACECSFQRLCDLNESAAEQWLADFRDKGKSAATSNAYREALVTFGNWLRKNHRLAINPFATLPTSDVKVDRRRTRRAMQEQELVQLLHVARWRPLAEFGRASVARDPNDEAAKGKRSKWTLAPLSLDTIDQAVAEARKRLSKNPEFLAELERRGRERALMYKCLVLTGLRKGELASLTIGQLDLASDIPVLILDAKDEKNREGSSIPLRADLADDLQMWLADREAARQKAARNAPTINFDT